MRKVSTDGIKIGFERMGVIFLPESDEEEDVHAQTVYDWLTVFKSTIQSYAKVL